MKFGQSFSIRKNLTSKEFAYGIWNPQMHQWRDVIEDYLYISRKRLNNKLSLFKIQVNIVQEIVSNIKVIDGYNKLEETLIEDVKKGKITKEDLEYQKEHFKSEIFSAKLINKALREIMDGIVWKLFKYNRPILYMLADKEPIETIRLDDGMLQNLNEFADVFLDHDAIAIYNDITNFLRVGDVTKIKKDESIEIIEVKTSKSSARGGRISRQKERMSELVEFFNTGLTNYDGKKLKIINSDIKQRNYLRLLQDAIKRARYRGYESLLIGSHLIIEVVDNEKLDDLSKVLDYFKNKHKSIQDIWEKNNDFVSFSFFTDKMNYSKNCAPFSIYPFDIETCADIMVGRLMIATRFNFTEILRIIKKAGWEIVDSIIFKSEKEIEELKGKDVKDVSFLKIRKGNITFDVPPSLIARMEYELLAPATLLELIEDVIKKGPQKEYDYILENYLDEQRIWH